MKSKSISKGRLKFLTRQSSRDPKYCSVKSLVSSATTIFVIINSYGPLAMVQLKKKESGQSKGFAFIKFKDLEVQEKVLLTRHMIKERWCDVKVPESQELKNAKDNASCKIFVARLSECITQDDIKGHFEKFGPVTDVYIPKPFRAFAFVTFQVF
jgi:RNA recognition motif-containing protein